MVAAGLVGLPLFTSLSAAFGSTWLKFLGPSVDLDGNGQETLATAL